MDDPVILQFNGVFDDFKPFYRFVHGVSSKRVMSLLMGVVHQIWTTTMKLAIARHHITCDPFQCVVFL